MTARSSLTSIALVLAVSALALTTTSVSAQDGVAPAEDEIATLRAALAEADDAGKLAAAEQLCAALEADGRHHASAAIWRAIRKAGGTGADEAALREGRVLLAFAEGVLARSGGGAGIRAAFEDARLALRRAREIGGNNTEIALGIARCHAAAGNQDAQVEELESALATWPDNGVLQRAAGFALLNTGGFERAIELLGPLSDADPSEGLLARAVSYCARMSGDEGLAVSSATRAIDAAPLDPEGWRALWVVFAQDNRFGELSNSIVAQAEARADNAVAAHYAGFACSAAGRVDDALEWLGRAWELDDQNLAARNRAARHMYVDRNDVEASAALYRDVLSRSPQNMDAISGLGFIAVQLGSANEHEKAAPYFADIAAVLPNDGTAQANLALSLRWAGRYDEAVASYERAIVASPEDAQIWNDFGLLLLVMKNDERATEVFKGGHEADPLHNDGLENLGFMARERGDLEAAAEWFRLAWDAGRRVGNPDLMQRHHRNADDARWPLPPLRP